MSARPRILLVEDDPSIRLLLEDELAYQGFDVRVEVEGESGLKAALEWKADLLLLDLMLPNVSGLEICRKLRSEGIKAPILLLTARDQEADKVVGLDSGANDYITKPFGVAELMARIRAHLRQQEMQTDETASLQFLDLRLNVRRFQAFRGELTDACKLTAKCIQLDPGFLAAHHRWIELGNFTGRRRETLGSLQLLFQQNAIQPDYLFFVGNIAKETCSAKDLEAALERNPADQLPKLGLARIAINDAAFEKAISNLDQLIESQTFSSSNPLR